MSDTDIRWHQRLDNYNKALAQLNKASVLSKERELTELEQQGLIQSFEFTHELAWKVMKDDYFYYQGNSNINGSRDATRTAFNSGLISDGEEWMNMIISRNSSSHTYDEEIATAIAKNILNVYIHLLYEFSIRMNDLRGRTKT